MLRCLPALLLPLCVLCVRVRVHLAVAALLFCLFPCLSPSLMLYLLVVLPPPQSLPCVGPRAAHPHTHCGLFPASTRLAFLLLLVHELFLCHCGCTVTRESE